MFMTWNRLARPLVAAGPGFDPAALQSGATCCGTAPLRRTPSMSNHPQETNASQSENQTALGSTSANGAVPPAAPVGSAEQKTLPKIESEGSDAIHVAGGGKLSIPREDFDVGLDDGTEID